MANYGLVGKNSGYLTQAATTLSTVAGAVYSGKYVNLPLNNPTSWNITSVCCTVTSTATAGNRVICLAIVDPNGKVVVSSTTGTQPASQIDHHTYGQAIGFYQQSTQVYGAPLPVYCVIPANCSIQIADRAAIDAADTVAIQLSYLV